LPVWLFEAGSMLTPLLFLKIKKQVVWRALNI
jgi:hypothetical protein